MSDITYFHEPKLKKCTLIVGLSGWMDGGDVSTGSMEYLKLKLGAVPFATLNENGFYILNFPGSMEYASLFRPFVKFEEGVIESFDYPKNNFSIDPERGIILFEGQEPNINWSRYADNLLELCQKFNVEMVLFIGSVTGIIPHTREARITCSISNEKLRRLLDKKGFHFSNYEGPSSFIIYLLDRCGHVGLDMISLVAEVPAYVQGYNPKSIETAMRFISGILGLQLDCEDLRVLGDEFEKRVTDLVAKEPELLERVQQIEEIYDNEVFDSEMGELKLWLQRRGVRLD
ncbi:MAG: PAC2 family protein [Planctomycetaceae bacterium]|nr:PAC2 family protein [Planctomycetaceae bacterium]